MVLHPTQQTIFKSKTRFKVICCGRRWGKTTLAVEEIYTMALLKEVKICYIAPTYQQARDIAWEMLKKTLQPIISTINESRLELRVRNNIKTESTITLRGWEAIETLRGQAFDLLVIDEVASMRNFWSGWQEVLRPTLTDTAGEVIFISTPKGYNHFHTLCQKQNDDKDFITFHFTSYDNPYIKKEDIDKAKTELAENQFAQEYLADFRKVEGLVFNLDEREIIAPIDISTKTEARIMGVDWGFRNPAAIIVLYLKDNEWMIVDEWKLAERTNPEIIQVLQNKLTEHKVRKIYCDSAEPDRIEECKRASLPVYEANKDVEGGISHVQNLLKEKRLKVCRSCTNTLEEFNTYQYPEGKDGKANKEAPEKMNDHLMDAMRYALYSYKPMSKNISTASPLINPYYPKI